VYVIIRQEVHTADCHESAQDCLARLDYRQ